MKTIAKLLFLVTLTSNCYSAGPITSIEETKTLSDTIINHFVKKEFQQGLALAKENWPLPQVEIDNLANQITTQWAIIDQRYGQPTGHEFVREERIGSSFVRYYYLHKFQNHSIYWLFTFYKPSDNWKVNGVRFKDDLNFLFEPVR